MPTSASARSRTPTTRYEPGDPGISQRGGTGFVSPADNCSQILRLAADAQVGGPSEKVSVVAYVQNLLKDGSPRDVESLELLEWASADLMGDAFFAQAIGPLRVRLVKANPKDRVTAVDCLESCLLHWDLSSAQQVGSIYRRSQARNPMSNERWAPVRE